MLSNANKIKVEMAGHLTQNERQPVNKKFIEVDGAMT